MTVFNRREALQQMACGVGGIGLATLLADQGLFAAEDHKPGPHHTPKAKSLIFLNMQGGPTQFETFDYKPEMTRQAGKDISPSNGSVRFTGKILPSAFPFKKCGQSGLEVCEILPHMGTVADELCVIKSMVGDSQAHPEGQKQALTTFGRKPWPSLGSWILYGLGSENKDLPGYVYLANGTHHGSAYLPASCQGMPVGTRVPNLKRPPTTTESQQRDLLDALKQMNQRYAEANASDPLVACIEAAELAFRMQMSCPEAVDLTKENAKTLELYGITDKDGSGSKTKAGGRGLSETRMDVGTQCLIARRLVERGVRVVTICIGGRRGWDQHSNLKTAVEQNALVIDQPIAGLIKDLKSRGLLDSTLVMWGGEFGRTSYAQGADGRDHFHKGFTYWLAGGGAKAGTTYGETSELGLDVVRDKVHFHDLHASVLHLMGLNHEKLTYRYAGRDQKPIDVYGEVVHGLMR